jgi:hypothetical protein
MNRLLNILVLVDQKYELDLWVEKGSRSLGKVLTIGRSGGDYEVDIQVGEDIVSVEQSMQQLPNGLKPDLIIATSNTLNLFNQWPTSITKIAIHEQDFSGHEDDGFKVIAKINESNTINPPYINIPPLESANSQKVLGMLVKFAFGQIAAVDYEALKDLIPLQKVTVPTGVSFVIAVLDESPSSKFSINTLLDDLKVIEGEVICIFNDKELGEKICKHPRIDKYAILSENIGVGRAWNVGMMMTTQETVFILNSDLHLEASGVDTIKKELYRRENYAIAGPCGGYNDFVNLKDLYYIDDKKHCSSTLVDQVSGFYFAIKRKVFSDYNIQFFPEYIPCYMEEWDIALQLRKYDLLSIRVPVFSYEHAWGGTINGLEKINCLGKVYNKDTILKQNQNIFTRRWQTVFSGQNNNVFIPS